MLIDVTAALLRSAAALASAAVRTLDAIHLASALRIGADAVLVYDRRLQEAVRAQSLALAVPR